MAWTLLVGFYKSMQYRHHTALSITIMTSNDRANPLSCAVTAMHPSVVLDALETDTRVWLELIGIITRPPTNFFSQRGPSMVRNVSDTVVILLAR